MTMNALVILRLLFSSLLLGGALGQVHNTGVGILPVGTYTNCMTQADIVFIMDSSGSIMPTDYDKMLQFVAEITKNFNIGPNDVQFGGIVFGTNVNKIFDLTTYTDHALLEQGILNVHQISGQTYTDKALQMAREDLFTAANGARPGIPKLAIVFTDGQSSDPTALAQQAALLKQSGVSVMSIGIGSGVDVNELGIIASSPNDVFQVAGFDVLQTIEISVANKTCQIVNNNAQNQICAAAADVLFIMDASGSVQQQHFDSMLQFVSDLSKGFNLGQDDVQFGAVTFGSSASRIFDFGTYTDHAALEQAIMSIPYTQGDTATDKALQIARMESFTQAYGARPNVPKIAIVFTDGQATDASATATQAQLLKDSGIYVISVGIGASTDQQELEMLASDPAEVFQVGSYDVLNTIMNKLATTTCNIVNNAPQCQTAADIMFIMDGSGSVQSANFDLMLKFVANLTRGFALGPMDNQFGAITFSDAASMIFDLDAYTNHSQLEQAIDGIPYLGGGTSTHLALRLAREQGFTTAHGARANIPQIAIVFTDGQSGSPSATAAEVQLLKDMGVGVISIGIGPNVNPQELETLASTPNDVFTVLDYQALDQISKALTNTTCYLVNSIMPRCEVDVDIMFIMDSSASIDPPDYTKMLNFLVDVTRNFNLVNDTVRFGAMVFGDKPEMVFDLDEYTNHSQIEQALLAAPHLQESTHTDLALQLAWEEAFTPYRGSRPGVPNIAIVLTDGQSIDENRTAEQAQLLKDTGALVMSVGISDKVDPKELNTIASAPEYVFQVANFDLLNTIQKELANYTCRAATTTTPAPMTTPSPSRRCHDLADIIFLMDSSGSISAQDYLQQLAFAVNVTDNFNLGPNEARFGGVIFGTNTQKLFDLQDYGVHQDLLNALMSATHMKTGTNLTEALEMIHNTNMFGTQSGGRTNASKVLIVMTDGQSTSAQPPNAAAQVLKNEGVQIISIGIGNSVDLQELHDIASAPSDVFQTPSYNTLYNILQDVANRTCGALTPPARSCSELADIIFVIDSSDGVSDANYEVQLQFAANVTEEFDVSPTDARFGAIVYADDVLEVYNLKDYTNHLDLSKNLETTPHLLGDPDLGNALNWVLDEGMFDPASGGRVNAPKIVVVLEDTQSVSTPQAIQAANALKNSGAVIFPIGVENYNLNELQQIGSGVHNVFKVSHFSMLPYIKQELVDAICDYAKEYTTI